MSHDIVHISAESEEDAKEMLRPLLQEQLAVGGVIVTSPAMFWWKKEIVEMPYVFAMVFAPSANREKIKETVRKHTKEEVPVVLFSEIKDSTHEFRQWVDAHTATDDSQQRH